MATASGVTWPKRGEVWLVDFEPTRGAEIKKTRPALVIQSVVLLNQIRSIDKSRLLRRTGQLEPHTLQAVEQALRISFGM